MTAAAPQFFKLRVKGTAETRSRTRAKARQHEVVLDEPPNLHGSDLAANPLETMLSSFIGCTNVVAHTVADERGLNIRGMEFSVTGLLDRRVAAGDETVTIPFPKIELDVVVDTDASDDEIDSLKHTVAKRCPVSVILRQAGTEIVDEWRKNSGDKQPVSRLPAPSSRQQSGDPYR